jgi:2-iminobutanoate/2-iminopropanoate deaminase
MSSPGSEGHGDAMPACYRHSAALGSSTRPGASAGRICRNVSTLIRGERVARHIVYTPKAARPAATYSQAVKAAGLVFVSGTAPHDPVSGQIAGATIQEQTRQCLTNIAAILEEAGSSLDKIVSVTVILADEDDFAGMNEEWLRWFPVDPPARQGAKLPAKIPGLKVSIAAIAEA